MRRLLQVVLILSVAAAVPAFARGSDETTTKTQGHWGNNTTKPQPNTTGHWGTPKARPTWGNHRPAPVPPPTRTVVVQPNNGTPPGWAHGRKVGWRGGDEPPGWEKRHHRYERRHHRRDWDRDHDRDWARRHHREREHFRRDRDHDRH